MATATINPPPASMATVTLDLSMEEAIMLRGVLACVSTQSPIDTYRIWEALADANVEALYLTPRMNEGSNLVLFERR